MPDGIAARVTLTNLLTPYLNPRGDVGDANGARCHLESRRGPEGGAAPVTNGGGDAMMGTPCRPSPPFPKPAPGPSWA